MSVYNGSEAILFNKTKNALSAIKSLFGKENPAIRARYRAPLSYQWEVVFPSDKEPLYIGKAGVLQFLATSVNLVINNFQVESINQGFRTVHVPVRRNLAEDVTINFIDNASYDVMAYFDYWCDQIQSRTNGAAKARLNYARDMELRFLSDTGKVMRTYTLINAYPYTTGSLNVDYAGSSLIDISVVFKCENIKAKRNSEDATTTANNAR